MTGKSTAISVVLPCHNDAAYLPFSLASLARAPIDELIIVLDRCTDTSPDLVAWVFKNFRHYYPFLVKVIEKYKHTWKHSIAEAFHTGFEASTGELVYTMAADMWTDPDIYRMKYLFNRFGFVSFHYSDYGSLRSHYNNFLRKLPNIKGLRGYTKVSGHFAVKREIWKDTGFQDSNNYDTLFWEELFRRGIKHFFVKNCRNRHLRTPGGNRERQLSQGKTRKEMGMGLFKVLMHSALYVKPYALIGYLQA